MKYTEQDTLKKRSSTSISWSSIGSKAVFVVDAICMRLLAAIDALSRLPSDRLDDLFGDDWRHMRGTWNRIAHGHGDLNFGIIASTVDDNVPQVIAIVRRELENTSFHSRA